MTNFLAGFHSLKPAFRDETSKGGSKVILKEITPLLQIPVAKFLVHEISTTKLHDVALIEGEYHLINSQCRHMPHMAVLTPLLI